MIVLIDSGATHNFNHKKLVDELNLLITKEKKFGVTIGDGKAREGRGICKRVEVKLTKLKIVADFLTSNRIRQDGCHP